MSAIDDARTLVQDIVVPDLKAFSARVDALETNRKQRFDSVEKLAEARHELMLVRLEAGFAAIGAKFSAIDVRFDKLIKSLNTDPRLEILEAAQGKVQ